MTINKPEIIGYIPTVEGKPRCGEDGFSLEDYTDQLRDNPAGLKLEPVILMRDYEVLQARLIELGEDLVILTEERDHIGRNSSAFENRMGNLQIENGKLRDKCEALQAERDQLRKDAVSEAVRSMPRLKIAAVFNDAYYARSDQGSDGEQCRAGVLAVIDAAMQEPSHE